MSAAPLESNPDDAVPAAVASPCTGVCVIDPATQFCQGCWRTIDEIAAWSLFDDQEKLGVWAELRERAGRADPAL